METLKISMGPLTWNTMPESIAKIAGSLFTTKLGKAVVHVLEPFGVLAFCYHVAQAGLGLDLEINYLRMA